jgi:type II secretory ATPase GspE/PulE/Tfp pilus assembly ATPase PilB-like protein
MPVPEPVRTLILQGASSRQIRQAAAQDGMRSLRQDGWRLVVEGRTTVDELLRVTKDEQANGQLRRPEPQGG